MLKLNPSLLTNAKDEYDLGKQLGKLLGEKIEVIGRGGSEQNLKILQEKQEKEENSKGENKKNNTQTKSSNKPKHKYFWSLIIKMFDQVHCKHNPKAKPITDNKTLIQSTYMMTNELGLINKIYKTDTSDGKTINIITADKNTEVDNIFINKENSTQPFTLKILKMIILIYYNIKGINPNSLDMKYFAKLVKGNENTYGIVSSNCGVSNAFRSVNAKVGRKDKKFILSSAESLCDAVLAFGVERMWNDIKSYSEIRDEFKREYDDLFEDTGYNTVIMQLAKQSVEEFQRIQNDQINRINMKSNNNKKSTRNFHKFWELYKTQRRVMVKSLLLTIDEFREVCKVIDRIYSPVIEEVNKLDSNTNMNTSTKSFVNVSVTSLIMEQLYEIIHSDPFLYSLFAVTKLYSDNTDSDLELRDEVISFEALIANLPKNLETLRVHLGSRHEKVEMVYEFQVEHLEKILGLTSVKPYLNVNNMSSDGKGNSINEEKNKLDELYEFILSTDKSNVGKKKKKKKKGNKVVEEVKEETIAINIINSGEPEDPKDPEIENFKELLLGDTINAKEVVKIKPAITPEWVNTINTSRK